MLPLQSAALVYALMLIGAETNENFTATINHIGLLQFELYTQISSFTIVSIQRDLYTGLVLVADTNALRTINLTSDLVVLLFGRDLITTDSIDGHGSAATFNDVVDVVQKPFLTYVVQRRCIREINRETRNVSTLSGDCNRGGNIIGGVRETRYYSLVSALWLNETWLVVAENEPDIRIISLHLNTDESALLSSSRTSKISTIFTDRLQSQLYVFTNSGLKVIDIYTGKVAKSIHLKERVNHSVSSENVTIGHIRETFFHRDVIIGVDNRYNILKLIDVTTWSVTSVCRVLIPSAQYKTVLQKVEDITSCLPPSFSAISILPEKDLMLLAIGYHIYKIPTRFDLQSCISTLDCGQFCIAGKLEKCTTNLSDPEICDPFLNQCTIKCGDQGRDCPPSQTCIEESGHRLCRRLCSSEDDCLFGQHCFEGSCVKEDPLGGLLESPPTFCLSQCQCFYIPSTNPTMPSLSSSICQVNQGSVFTISAIEDVYMLRVLASSLPASHFSKLWVTIDRNVSLQDVDQELELYETPKLARMYPDSNLYYDIENLGWGNSTLPVAFTVCKQKFNSTMSADRISRNDSNFKESHYSTCDSTSSCSDGHLQACVADLSCRQANSCCEMRHLLDYGINITDWNLLAPLNFSEIQTLPCIFHSGNQTGLAIATCVEGKWNVSECAINSVSAETCSLKLPSLYTILSSSSTTSIIRKGDIILVACDLPYNNPQAISTFTCGGRVWLPALSTLSRQACLHQESQSPRVQWMKEPTSGKCYGLAGSSFTHLEAIVYCTTISSALVKIQSADANSFINSIINSSRRSSKRFWINGKYDTGYQRFTYRSNKSLSYFNLPAGWNTTENSCIQVNGSDHWLLSDCSLESSEAGAICERHDLPIYQGYADWTTWSSCSPSQKRYRRRSCNRGMNYCTRCTKHLVKTGNCCSEPAFNAFSYNYPKAKEYVPGFQMTYQCYYGYTILTNDSRKGRITCQIDGRWNASPPACSAVPCDLRTLSAPPGSNSYLMAYTVPGDYYFGSYVYRVCNQSGFVFTNSSVSRTKIMCQSGGWWVGGSTQTCEERNCGRVPDIENAMWNRTVYLSTIKEERREKDLVYYLDQIIFNCLPDYHYRQSVEFTLTCQSDGSLDLLQPRCVEKSCGRMTADLPKYAHIASQLPVKLGENVNLTCDESYVLDKETREETQLVICVEINRWQLVDYRPCVLIYCESPDPATNIKSTTETNKVTKVGEKIVYLCADGMIDYRNRRAVVEIECLPDLTWSAPPANCSDVVCEDPGEAEFTTRNVSGYHYKDTITYKCLSGYIVPGSKGVTFSTITCQEDGRWDKMAFPCVTAVPYHALKIETLIESVLTISVIQKRSYEGVTVHYKLIAQGVRTSSVHQTNKTIIRQFNISSAGRRVVTTDLSPGYLYDIELQSTGASWEDEVYRQTLSTKPVYVKNSEPRVYYGLSVNDSVPTFRHDLTAVIALPFDILNGEVKAFTIIVCDMITYLPKEYYDGKLVEKLASYSSVTAVEEDRPIWGCYQTMAPCPVDDYSNCKDVTGLEKGYIRYYEIQRLGYRVGAENCEIPSDQVTYCNGLLKPTSTYCIKLRAYSDDGYLDSPCSSPVKTRSEFNMNLLSSLIIPITLVIIIVILGEGCKTRFRSQAEVNLSPAGIFLALRQSQVNEMPDLDTHETSSDRCRDYMLEVFDVGIIKEPEQHVLASYKISEIQRTSPKEDEPRYTDTHTISIKQM